MPGPSIILSRGDRREAAGTAVSNGAYHETASYSAVNYGYIADTYLASVTSGANTYYLYYDALGRCVKRSLTANGVTTATYYLLGKKGSEWACPDFSDS